MTLSTRQRQEALTNMLWRELRRFEEQTGEQIERIVMGRVYEDISSVQVKVVNEHAVQSS